MKKLLCFTAVLFAFLPMSAAHAQVQYGTETLTLTDTICSVSTPCTAQIYRAVGACPASGIGTLTYTALTTTLLGTVLGTPAQGTTWQYADTTPVPGQTYCYYATVTYANASGVSLGGPASSPSPTFTAVIPLGTPATPPAISGVWTPAA